ncbi:MAG: hypothetical protein J2P58_11505 [Acidimicrobiaceae bacterium]|nr:hypothetical protein [Acidimicrobiaceae bacterium]
MNIGELKQRLVDEGVSEDNYFIVGIDDPDRKGPRDVGELIVDHSDDRTDWFTYSYERGANHNEQHYRSEAEACEAAWEGLKGIAHRQVRRLTPEERERARQNAQKQVADYEEWARNARGDT